MITHDPECVFYVQNKKLVTLCLHLILHNILQPNRMTQMHLFKLLSETERKLCDLYFHTEKGSFILKRAIDTKFRKIKNVSI